MYVFLHSSGLYRVKVITKAKKMIHKVIDNNYLLTSTYILAHLGKYSAPNEVFSQTVIYYHFDYTRSYSLYPFYNLFRTRITKLILLI